MKLGLILCFGVVLCVTPALGQFGFDIGKILGNFKKPYSCGQCPAAYREFVRQLCHIVTRPVAVFDPFNLNGVCEATIHLSVVLSNAYTFCAPFGVCKYGTDPKANPITCDQCPGAVKQSFANGCSIIPDFFPSSWIKWTCYGIQARLLPSDLRAPCSQAGWCQ